MIEYPNADSIFVCELSVRYVFLGFGSLSTRVTFIVVRTRLGLEDAASM